MSKPEFHCDLCPYVTTSQKGYYVHRGMRHKDVPKFTCEHCHEEFQRKTKFDKHLRMMHAISENKAKCDQCPSVLATHTLMVFHRYKYHPDAPPYYKCAECGEAFHYKTELQNHINTVHAIVIECDICKKEFDRTTRMHEHRIRKHASYEWKQLDAAYHDKGENWCEKLYFLVSTSKDYLKVGITRSRMHDKLIKLQTQDGTLLYMENCWLLSEKFTTRILLERLEKRVHARMKDLGFKSRGTKWEYFWLQNADLEIPLITQIIEEMINMAETTYDSVVIKSTIVPTDTAKPRPKRQLSQKPKRRNQRLKYANNEEYRESMKRKSKIRSEIQQPTIYCFTNNDNIIKVGETVHDARSRLNSYNQTSVFGRMYLRHQFLLPYEYTDHSKRCMVEDEVLAEASKYFDKVNTLREHFSVSSDNTQLFVDIMGDVIYKVLNKISL